MTETTFTGADLAYIPRRRAMALGPDVAAVARLIAEPTRASLLLALMEGEALPGRELAGRAGIAPSTASGHLSKLLSGGFVSAERIGRERWFRIAEPAVAEALEALCAIAPAIPVRSLRQANAAQAIREARTCYDHLAGRLGVEISSALVRQGVLTDAGDAYALGPAALDRLEALGIRLDALKSGSRPLVRTCLDWTERRPHVGGALGAAITSRLFERGWLARHSASRAVVATAAGSVALRAEFDIDSV